MDDRTSLRQAEHLSFPWGLLVSLLLVFPGCSLEPPELPARTHEVQASPSAASPTVEVGPSVPLPRDAVALRAAPPRWERTGRKRNPVLAEFLSDPPTPRWRSAALALDPFPLAVETGGAAKPHPDRRPVASARSDERSRSELSRMEFAFRGALLNLFGAAGSGSRRGGERTYGDLPGEPQSSSMREEQLFENPFEEALAEQMAEPLPAPQMADANLEPVPEANTPPPASPEVAPQAGARIQSPVEAVDEIPDGPFRFLLAGNLGSQGEFVSRALRDEDGRFVLENFTRYSLSTGFLTFGQEERVLTGDLDGDGRTDLAVVRVTGEVNVFQGQGGVRFQQWTSLAPGAASAIAAFEMTGDARLDLVVALSEVPRLAIYRQAQGGFSYDRELVLPFQPGFLVGGREGAGEPELYVFDTRLEKVVALARGARGVFRAAPAELAEAFHEHEVSLPGETGAVYSIRLGESIGLVRRTGDGISALADLQLAPGGVLALLGDYSSSGTSQLLIIP